LNAGLSAHDRRAATRRRSVTLIAAGEALFDLLTVRPLALFLTFVRLAVAITVSLAGSILTARLASGALIVTGDAAAKRGSNLPSGALFLLLLARPIDERHAIGARLLIGTRIADKHFSRRAFRLNGLANA